MADRCIFFDRDGIVNDARDYYVLKPERLFMNEAFFDALKVVNDAGLRAIIVTNQKCISKGLLTDGELDEIHHVLRSAVADRGLSLDGIYYSPGPEGHPELKPEPGMLIRAAREHDLDLVTSIMIGDKERDVECGNRAGCQQNILVSEATEKTVASHQVPNMEALPELLRELVTSE